MVEGDSKSHLCVLLVGAVRDDLMGQLAQLACEYEAALVRCDDVYAAVAELASPEERYILAIGRLRELAREDGRFFSIAARNAARCCGVLEKNVPLERDEVLAAVRSGVAVVAQTDEIRGVFEDWLGVDGGLDPLDALSGLASEEFRASEAELNALLGLDTDG